MEFLVINDNKLKVVMTEEECQSYDIDTADADFCGAEVRGAIRRILERAKAECAFSSEGERILAQIYPTPSGGCELFITKLTGLASRTRNMINRADCLTTIDERVGVYEFSDTETLIRALRAVYREGIRCDVYRSDTGECYISIREGVSNGISEFEVLVEYGERLSSLPPHVFAERGSCIARGNGIESLLVDKHTDG